MKVSSMYLVIHSCKISLAHPLHKNACVEKETSHCSQCHVRHGATVHLIVITCGCLQIQQRRDRIRLIQD